MPKMFGVADPAEDVAVANETRLGLRIVAPILVAGLLLETVAHWLGTWGPEANVALGCLVVVTPIALRWLWWPPQLEYVHTGVAFVVAVVVTNSVAHVASGTLASRETLLTIGMVVTGAFVLSRAWLLPLLAAQVASWLFIVAPPGQLVAMPIAVTLVALAIHQARRRGVHRAHMRETALEAANAELYLAQNALDLAGDPILWIATDGSINYANQSAAQLLGYSTVELVGKPIEEIDLRRPIDDWQTSEIAAESTFETVYRSKDDKGHPVEVRSRRISVEGRSFQCVIARDLTPRLRVEEKLRRAQRLESLSVLAGGLAHDFNNLLAAMVGNAELARDALEAQSPARPRLDEVLGAAERATLLTTQLLAYAGKAPADKQRLDLSDEVEQISNLLAGSLPKGVRLEIEVPTHLPAVLADRAQLQQVLMNFVLNAGEAIGDAPGVVHVRTLVRNLDAQEASRLEPAAERAGGCYVGFEVRDDGGGMDETTRAHIFDPFFTTKSHGRGLGLAAVLGITRSHAGGIEVESREGAGSIFRVLLPAAGALVARDSRPPEAPLECSGLALVVDDEDAVRRVSRLGLESFGFDVIEACDGVEALEAVGAHKDDLRLILLDLTMPRMGGREALRAIHAIRPDIPVVVTSGYDPSHEAMAGVEGGPVAFLKKPFRRNDLARSVRDVLLRADALEGLR